MDKKVMSLDDIIALNRKQKGIRSEGFRSSKEHRSGKARSDLGRFKRFHSSAAPEGKWKHDKYQDLDAEVTTSFSKIGARNPNKMVKVLLSNLHPNVTTADLEELFEPYNFDTTTVHYNESGNSLGTGDINLKRKDALKLVDELAGMAIDGTVVKITLVDAASSMAHRVEFPAKVQKSFGGIRKMRSDGGSVSRKPLGRRDEHDDRGDDRNTASSTRQRTRVERGRKEKTRVPKLTEEELDKQLDAYMTKTNKETNDEDMVIF